MMTETELDDNDGCTAMSMHALPLNCTPGLNSRLSHHLKYMPSSDAEAVAALPPAQFAADVPGKAAGGAPHA